jgi:SNF2 family DNA or RNA helicase
MSNHEIGAVLADDMGLGKTVQVLAAISKIKKSQSLIVAPTITLGLTEWSVCRILKNPISQLQLIKPSARILNFSKKKNLSILYLMKLIILRIKNSESQAYMACKLINARKKIALTGTPVENSLKDLFSILSIVNPGLISNTLAGKYANEMDPEAISLLSKSLGPFILIPTLSHL